MLELWDAYDNQFNKLDNIVLVRGDEIPDGIYHLVCEIAVRHTDGQYLLMQRDKKEAFWRYVGINRRWLRIKRRTPLRMCC